MFNKMTLSDLKIYLLNSVALVASFSEMEELLKIILLIGSISSPVFHRVSTSVCWNTLQGLKKTCGS